MAEIRIENLHLRIHGLSRESARREAEELGAALLQRCQQSQLETLGQGSMAMDCLDLGTITAQGQAWASAAAQRIAAALPAAYGGHQQILGKPGEKHD